MLSSLSKSRIVTSEVFRTNRWSCVHNAFTVHITLLFALCLRSVCALRSSFLLLTQFCSALTHRSLTVRSAIAHRSLRLRSPFTHRSWGKVESFRDFYTRKMKTKTKKWPINIYFFYFLAKYIFTSRTYEKLSHRVVYLSYITNDMSPYLKYFNIRS